MQFVAWVTREFAGFSAGRIIICVTSLLDEKQRN
jgi:hypothetical protein